MLKAVIVIFALGLAGTQATSCTDQKVAALTLIKSHAGGGILIPQCEKDGSFRTKQCNPNNGQCYCVDINGTRISPFTKGDLVCQCIRQREAATHSKKHGTFMPRCTDEGYYHKMQCYELIGECWCVDQTTGKKISPGDGNLKTCDCIRQRFEEKKRPLSLSPPIQCLEDGSYNPIQNNNGYVWCADNEGFPINNGSRSLRSCQCLLHHYKIHKEGLKGVYHPKCDSNGDYGPIQCYTGKDGIKHCWCSMPNGVKFPTPEFKAETCICYRNADKLKYIALSFFLPACS